jgi:outer membrane murein-binding lipoprotein Lpp
MQLGPERIHRRCKRWLAAAALAASVLVTGCGDESVLREDQARELRRVCQTLAARIDRSPAKIEAIGRKDLKLFYVGPPEEPRRGIDTFSNCV